MSIRVGTKVKCIDAGNLVPMYGETIPKAGTVYTVRAILTSNGNQCYRLREIVNPPHDYAQGTIECSFRASRFIAQTGKK